MLRITGEAPSGRCRFHSFPLAERSSIAWLIPWPFSRGRSYRPGSRGGSSRFAARGVRGPVPSPTVTRQTDLRTFRAERTDHLSLARPERQPRRTGTRRPRASCEAEVACRPVVVRIQRIGDAGGLARFLSASSAQLRLVRRRATPPTQAGSIRARRRRSCRVARAWPRRSWALLDTRPDHARPTP